MQPSTSFWDTFSKRGRIKQRWSRALKKTDIQKSLALLRTVLQQMYASPARSFDLWLPFLDTFLANERVRSLTARDLIDVENMGMFLQQTLARPSAPPSLALWQRVFAAYHAREEYLQARRLAEKLEADKSTNDPARAYCVRELARQGLHEDLHIKMYIKQLRAVADPQAETAIFQVLNTLFTVDFSASDAQLQSVNRVAESLLALNNPTLLALTPHIWVARGIYALCVKAAPDEARNYFEHRRQINQIDLLANLGVLACAIRLGMSKGVTLLESDPTFHEVAQSPKIAALLELHELVEWLDHPEAVDRQPVPFDAGSVARLAGLPLHRYVGDMAEATLGRLSLITGNAQQARRYFDTLLQHGLTHPAWGYYAAWAYLLCNDRTVLVDCLKKTSHWPGRWTIACMLLDLDPGLAAQSGAIQMLRSISSTETSVASVVRARLELAQTGVSTGDGEWEETDLLPEEMLEAGRTRLASALARNDRETAAKLTTRPWFRRLPFADSSFWLSLVEHNNTRRQDLLRLTATNWQYSRAALFLATASLRQGNWNQADQYVEQALAGRTDTRAELIRVFIEARTAPVDEAIQQAENLAVRGEHRAYYILGNLYFYKAARQPTEAQPARLQAALAWQRLLASGEKMLPEDLAALAACASFIAYPPQRAISAQALIESFQELDAAFHQPWLEWHVALALLWYGTPQAFAGLALTLFKVVEITERADDLIVMTLARALSRFAQQMEANDSTTKQFFQLLEHFAQQHIQPAVKCTLTSAMIAVLQVLYRHADEQQRAQIEIDSRQRLATDPRNGRLILWQVCLALRTNRKAQAMALLRTAQPDNPALTPLLMGLLDLLNNAPVSRITATADGQPTLGWDALHMALAIVSGRLEEGYELLLRQSSGAILTPWRVERLFPHLCLAVQRSGIEPPAFLKNVLQSQRAAASNSATLARLAACASALGDGEQACRLWEEALGGSAGNELPTGWRQAFVRVLCRQAVSDYAADQSMKAARKLRLAARWAMDDLGRQFERTRLLEHARSLELYAVPTLLLAYLFPDAPREAVPLGRYAIFGLTIAQNPLLVEALLQQEQEHIQQAWKQLLSTQGNNMRFLHTLSVIYREVALTKQERRTATEKDWLTSTTLWLLLLSTEAFWHYFAQERITGEREERQKLSEQQREDLWQDALENILVFHSTLARKSLAAGEYLQARIHARSLALGRQREQRLLAILEDANLTFPVTIEKARIEQIRTQAQKLLNDWGQSLLVEARRYIDDTGGEPRHKDYARGIAVLEPFIDLDVPLTRVLLTCLDWYNNWCSDLWTNGTQEQREKTTLVANLVCEKLQRLCEKKKSYSTENKAIALHLASQGRVFEQLEPERALHAYEEALAWGPNNLSIQQKIDPLHIKIVEQTVQSYANAQQFEQAYEAIALAESSLKQPQALQQLSRRILYQHARELKAQDSYTEALNRARQASALDPRNKGLQDFMNELEELIPEELNALAMRKAREALERQNADQALQQIALIPPGSRFFQQAQTMRSQTLWYDIITSTDKNALQKRAASLQQIIDSGGRRSESLPRAREELSIILARFVTDELQQIERLGEKRPEARRPRLIYAQSQIEEALELDSRNELAKQHLETLKKLLETTKEKR